MRSIIAAFFIAALAVASLAQTETLTNSGIILMTRAGLSKDLIVRKLLDSKGNYDTSAQSLIELKKAGVADKVIVLMFDSNKKNEQPISFVPEYPPNNKRVLNSSLTTSSRILLEPTEALLAAKTISIEKSSLHPSIAVLEKQFMKRKEWIDLNLNIVRYKESSDLHIEIGFVHLSLITHRYSWRVYDTKSGTIIAAGVTTSWGSRAKNLSKDTSKKLSDAKKQGKWENSRGSI